MKLKSDKYYHSKPDFFIVGAAKCGTTSLSNYLNQHPNIFAPSVKEPRYFVRNALLNTSDEDPLKNHILSRSVLDKQEYFKLYKREKEDARLTYDASIHYLFHYNEVIPKIKRDIGDVPIVIILRNPVKRAISNYNYLKEWHKSTIQEEFKREKKRKELNYNSFWYYTELGLYSHQIEAYLNNFSKVKIIFFQDLLSDQQMVYGQVLKFLSLEDYHLNERRKSNVTVEPNFALKFLRKTGIVNKFKSKINLKNWKKFKRVTKHILYKKSDKKISKSMKKKMNEFYKRDIKKVEMLTGRHLQDWYL